MENYGLIEMTIKKIPKRIWICFFSGIIVGVLTHLYMLTNKIPNFDDVINFTSHGVGVDSGRWFLHNSHPLGGRWSLPAVHGMIAIACLSAAACIICEILELRRTISLVLVSAIMLTFPSVTEAMTFMFTIHSYAYDAILMCLSVYLLRRFKFGFIPAVFCIVIGLGIYQPYVSIVISLMLISMMSDVFKGRKDGISTLKTGIKYAVVLLVSVGIYYIVCRMYGYVPTDEGSYAGVGRMGRIALSEMPYLILECYKRFLKYFIFRPESYVSPTMLWTTILTCICVGVLFLYLTIVFANKTKKAEIALLIIIAGLLPFAMAFIYFMAPEAAVSVRMLYSYALLYVFLVVLLEIAVDHWKAVKSNKHFIICVREAVILFMCSNLFIGVYANYLMANEAYFRNQIAYVRDVNFVNRILTTVENQDDFAYGDKVVILGGYYYLDNPGPTEINTLSDERFRGIPGVTLENGLITLSVRDDFIRMYLGFELPVVTMAEKEAIMNSRQYIDMPCWPDAGSIQKIEDAWVVKLCD